MLLSADNALYFDAQTDLLYQMKMDGNLSIIKSYRIVHGIKFPEVIEIEGDLNTVTIKTTKIVVNAEVSDDDFK